MMRRFAVLVVPKQFATICDIMGYGEFGRLNIDSVLGWVAVGLPTDIMQTPFWQSIRGWQRSAGQPARHRKDSEKKPLASLVSR
jgi:hypothetical protein